MERIAHDFHQHVPEDRHAEVHRELEAVQNLFAGVFERAAASGEIADIDPRVATLLFFHMVASWTWHSLEDPTLRPPDPRTGAETVTRIFLHGIAVPPQAE